MVDQLVELAVGGHSIGGCSIGWRTTAMVAFLDGGSGVGDRIMMVVGEIWGELDVDEGDACVCD